MSEKINESLSSEKEKRVWKVQDELIAAAGLAGTKLHWKISKKYFDDATSIVNKEYQDRVLELRALSLDKHDNKETIINTTPIVPATSSTLTTTSTTRDETSSEKNFRLLIRGDTVLQGEKDRYIHEDGTVHEVTIGTHIFGDDHKVKAHRRDKVNKLVKQQKRIKDSIKFFENNITSVTPSGVAFVPNYTKPPSTATRKSDKPEKLGDTLLPNCTQTLARVVKFLCTTQTDPDKVCHCEYCELVRLS